MAVNVARRRYRQQQWNAKLRGIQWLMTYVEWRLMWAYSGHWHERGRGRSQYVMARHADSGPYSVSNCQIVRSGKNVKDVWADPDRRASIGRKMGESRTGKPRSPAFCAKLSARSKGNKYALGSRQSPEARAKISTNNARAMLGKKHSLSTRRKMSLSHQRRLRRTK